MSNGNICVVENPAGASYTLMQQFGSNILTAVRNLKAFCCTPSSHFLPDSLLKGWRAKTRVDYGRLWAVHCDSRSYQTKHLRCDRRIHFLATNSVPAQQSTAKPTTGVKLQMVPFIHNVFSCSGRDDILELDKLEPLQKTRSSRWRHGTSWYPIGSSRMCRFHGSGSNVVHAC